MGRSADFDGFDGILRDLADDAEREAESAARRADELSERAKKMARHGLDGEANALLIEAERAFDAMSRAQTQVEALRAGAQGLK